MDTIGNAIHWLSGLVFWSAVAGGIGTLWLLTYVLAQHLPHDIKNWRRSYAARFGRDSR